MSAANTVESALTSEPSTDDSVVSIEKDSKTGRNRTMLRPTAAAVGAAALLSLVFVVLLDFLVVISFVGQALWASPRLLEDHLFALPAYLWVGVAFLALMAFLRIATQRVIVSDTGVQVKGLFRRPQSLSPWSQVRGIWAVRDVYRGKAPKDPVDEEIDAQDALILMRRDFTRIANVSGAFYGSRAQTVVLAEAEKQGVKVEYIDHARPRELAHQIPGSQTFVDRHPNVLVLIGVLFFIGHNVLTFMIWGI